MNRYAWPIAVLLTLTACKTQGEADADTEVAAATETTAPAAEPPDPTPQPEAANAFKPVKIPGTPHDEEGTMVTLTWAAESGKVDLFGSIAAAEASSQIDIEKGGELEYEESAVLVTEGTRLAPAEGDVALTGASAFSPETGALAEGSRDEAVKSTDTVYMLKYAGEGTCYMQLNDDVFLANCPNDEFGEHERKPAESQWWIMLGDGWLQVDDRVNVETKSTM